MEKEHSRWLVLLCEENRNLTDKQGLYEVYIGCWWLRVQVMTLPGDFWARWPHLAGKLSCDVITTQLGHVGRRDSLIDSIMPSSHHRQDHTRLSCLVSGVNRIGNKSSVVLTTFWDWTKQFGNYLSPTVLTCRQFSTHRCLVRGVT